MAEVKDTAKRGKRAGAGLKLLIITGFLLFVAAVLSVPFVYETQTLWYKLGFDKTLLRAGQMFGLVTLVLLFTQVVLGVRVKLLDDVFGTAAVMRYHRANGVMLLFMAIGHVVLVLIPEGIDNLPLGWKFWPQLVGGGLLVILGVTVVVSRYREKLRLNYAIWLALHKPLAYLALLLALVHVLFVSESFRGGIPRLALIIVFIVVIGLVLAKKVKVSRRN